MVKNLEMVKESNRFKWLLKILKLKKSLFFYCQIIIAKIYKKLSLRYKNIMIFRVYYENILLRLILKKFKHLIFLLRQYKRYKRLNKKNSVFFGAIYY